MPFTPTTLSALAQGNGFTLWHYRTADLRTTVRLGGYFATAPSPLRPGDLMILQAGDSLALQGVQSASSLSPGGQTIAGDVLPPVRIVQFPAPAQRFVLRQSVAAIVRSIVLLPLATLIAVGGTVPVTAQVRGPVASVVFSLRDANGAEIPPARTIAVVNGVATTSFPAPPPGPLYRIRATDAANPALRTDSPSFAVGADLTLLLREDGFRLLLEPGTGALRQ